MRKALLSLTVLWSLVASAQRQLYVSAAAADGGDGSRQRPFADVQSAIDHAASMKGMARVTINLLPGDYWLSQPIVISRALGHPLTVKGDAADMPRLIGGTQITGWRSNGKGVYAAEVGHGVGQYGLFEQLYVNGRRAQLARTPNKGWISVRGFSQTEKDGVPTMKVSFDPRELQFLLGVPKNKWADMKMEFVHNWDVTIWRPTSQDAAMGQVEVSGRGVYCQQSNPIKAGSRCVFYGYPAALDSAGEWVLDRSSRRVSYMPRQGEHLTRVLAPRLYRLLDIKGSAGAYVDDVTFENVAFECTGHWIPPQGDGASQGAASWEAAIDIDYASNVRFLNCKMTNFGGAAIWLHQHTRTNTVQHCYFRDVGASAVKLGEAVSNANPAGVPRGNIIDNNIILECGREMPGAAGILLLQARDSRITHNVIADLRYTGISAGWTWGYDSGIQHSACLDNEIAYNHIHHIGWGELSDMGGIYTLGESDGTTITGNVIHDVLAYDYGGWGIYLDEGSSGVTVSDNLVYNTKNGGFHQHYGRRNVITNNIFALGKYYQLQMTRPEDSLSFTFMRNIVFQTCGATLSGSWAKANIHMDHNLYYSTTGSYDFAGNDWSSWQRLHDQNSVLANPLFADPAAGNFHLRPSSPARRIGFKPFGYSQAGVYGSDAWKNLAKLPAQTITRFAVAWREDTNNRELFGTSSPAEK